MSCQIIDGKAIAQRIRDEVKLKAEELKRRGITPGLAVVLVGDDPASHLYVGFKEKACREVGFYSEIIKLPAGAAEREVLAVVEELNSRPEIHGILVQLPLPKQVREEIIISSINPDKDVDGAHPLNMGCLFMGRPRVIPCTPYGCLKLIEAVGYDLSGKHAVVVGRSNIVGKPMASLLLSHNATVTVCHSRTKNLGTITRKADVLVVAAGKANFIRGEMIKPGALVLDVGINRFPGGKVVGDVDFSSASQVAGIMTPVPGGVGPMTVAMLMVNTLQAAERDYEDGC